MSGGVARPASGSDDVRERRGGHPRLPGRITDLEQVARRIEEVQLAAGEEAVLAVDELSTFTPRSWKSRTAFSHSSGERVKE